MAGIKHIKALRRHSSVVKTWLENAEPGDYFVEDICSLFDADNEANWFGERSQQVKWLGATVQGEWYWAIILQNGVYDWRVQLFTRLLRKPDSLIYRLSQNAKSVKSWEDVIKDGKVDFYPLG